MLIDAAVHLLCGRGSRGTGLHASRWALLSTASLLSSHGPSSPLQCGSSPLSTGKTLTRRGAAGEFVTQTCLDGMAGVCAHGCVVLSRRPLALRDWLHVASTARFVVALAVALMLVWRLRLRRGRSGAAQPAAAVGSRHQLLYVDDAAATSQQRGMALVQWTAVAARTIVSVGGLAVALHHIAAASGGTARGLRAAVHRPSASAASSAGADCAGLSPPDDQWLLSITAPSLALCPGLVTPVGLFVASWLQVAVPVSSEGSAHPQCTGE